ncbi:ras GEF [Phlebopus sp. FC_14]|nr:ras GEF [Phlebopus sp. FC_14]
MERPSDLRGAPQGSRMRNSIRGLPAIPSTPTPIHSNSSRDFWIPQVTEDGQIYYANTLTGQLSRDLPRDVEDDHTNGDLAGLTTSQSSSRAGTGSKLGFAPSRVLQSLSTETSARLQTEIADSLHPTLPQGRQLDNPVSLTAPERPLPHFRSSSTPYARARASTETSSPSNRPTTEVPDSLAAHLRQRSYSTSDPSHLAVARERRESRIAAFSNSNLPAARKESRLKEISTVSDIPQVKEPSESESPRTSTQTMPASWSSSAPELVSELLQRARRCISSAIVHLQQFGIPREADDEDIVDNLINSAITSIRDLLYVVGPSFGHFGRKGDRRTASNASQTPLIPAQRRAIATLSKFVLSARAVLNDGPWNESDSISHLRSDAEELENSLIDFVSIAQGVRGEQLHGDYGQKLLRGCMTAPHAASRKGGAGAAGTWKGFGWVNIDDNEEAPRRNLDRPTFNEFVGQVTEVQERLGKFTEALRATQPADFVALSGKELIKQLSSLLLFLGDIHIARHVDIEPVNQDKLVDGPQYSRTVDRARVLVRAFEATAQALYDDSAALLVTTQRVRRMELCESWRSHDESYDALEALSSSLDFNLQIARQGLESLLLIGQEQSNILERCNKSPIEWRMSQRSLVAAILADEALNALSNDMYDTTTDDTDALLNHVGNGAQPSPVEKSPIPPPVPSGKPIPPNNTPPQNPLEDEGLRLTLGLRLTRTPPRPDKIKAFFGDDAPSHYLISRTEETKPWYLRPNYDPAEVLIDPDGTVRGGTVRALVERLTAHEYADPKFSRAFLMTYRSFTTLDELLQLLVDRFWIQPPPKLDAQELGDWRQYKQYIIRMRVINTMKSMVQDEDVLEREELGILDRMAEFVLRDDVISIPAAKQLLVSIKRAQRGRNMKKMTLNVSVDPPPPPLVPKRIELFDIDPLELARQLTITESQLYQKIKPSECLQRSKQLKTEYHDGVANFIRRSNRIAHWVTYSILCKDDPRRRAAIMKQFISVADRCRLIRNFSTMLAIVSGLNSAPIHRLKRSWEQVSSRYMSQLETCETIINSYKNYNNYRTALAAVSPPCVPFVGVFLTALTHIQDGSKDYLPGNLVNFRKRQKTSEVIQDLQRWQMQPHNFHPLPSVLVFIDEALGQFGDQDASDVFWQLSLEREPREKEEDRLARVLHESGFF